MTTDQPQDRTEWYPNGNDEGVLVGGETPITLPATGERAGESFELTTRTIRFQCASGDWLEDEWTGIPAGELLDAATMSPETTHAVVAAADGYRTCIEITALVESVIAYSAADRSSAGFPRFVSAAVGGPRSVKNLVSVTPVELEPGEDPEAYEDLQLDETVEE